MAYLWFSIFPIESLHSFLVFVCLFFITPRSETMSSSSVDINFFLCPVYFFNSIDSTDNQHVFANLNLRVRSWRYNPSIIIRYIQTQSKITQSSTVPYSYKSIINCVEVMNAKLSRKLLTYKLQIAKQT